MRSARPSLRCPLAAARQSSRAGARRSQADPDIPFHGSGEAEIERISDQGVADADLKHAWHGGQERSKVLQVEVVTGVHAQPGAGRR